MKNKKKSFLGKIFNPDPIFIFPRSAKGARGPTTVVIPDEVAKTGGTISYYDHKTGESQTINVVNHGDGTYTVKKR